MKTTFRKIKECAPNFSIWNKLNEYWKPKSLDEEISISQILESNGIEDAVWALRTVKNKNDSKKICLFCIDIANLVLDDFKMEYPLDDRPSKAINTAKLFIDGKISKNQLEEAENDVLDAYCIASVDADDNYDYHKEYAACAAYIIYRISIAICEYNYNGIYNIVCSIESSYDHNSASLKKLDEIEELLKKYI